MERASWPLWSRVKPPRKPLASASFDKRSLSVLAVGGLALSLFVWFGPTWAAHMAIWICIFLALESFSLLLHSTKYKVTWLFGLVCALVLPIWVAAVIQYGPHAHTLANISFLIADVASIMAIASTNQRTLKGLVTSTLPVLIMVTAITICTVIEGANPAAFETFKWLHLMALLLIGLTTLDAAKHTNSFGPVSMIIVVAMASYWVGTFTQILPTASYLIEHLTWADTQGRIILTIWICLVMISATVQQDCITLKEFTLKRPAYGSPASGIGSVELAIWVLPLMAVTGFFNLTSTSFRVLALSGIVSAALFIRRFRVLQIREMETAERLHLALATDPLTGALNRTGLAQHWDENHKGATVAFIDLDQFKPINDRYGHVVGDQVLQVLGTRIKNSIRCNDVVCRWGGDEFLVVGPSMDSTHAEAFCERIRHAIQAPITVKGNLVLRMDASIGYALVSPGVDFVTATEQADRMMYLKKKGKQRGSQVEPNRAQQARSATTRVMPNGASQTAITQASGAAHEAKSAKANTPALASTSAASPEKV